jgi:hypothetical protein
MRVRSLAEKGSFLQLCLREAEPHANRTTYVWTCYKASLNPLPDGEGLITC